MNYNILQAKIDYKDGHICRVTVLVEISDGDVRAIFATTKFRNGYHYLSQNEVLSDELLQTVAGYGMETVDRDTIFPNWNSKVNSI